MDDIFATRWGPALKLELKVAQIMTQQRLNGWQLDLPLIKQHIETLESEVSKIDDEILPSIPFLKVVPKNSLVSEPFRKDGELKEVVKRWKDTSYPDSDVIVHGPFSRVYWEQINLDSDDQVKTYLLGQGWVPTEWNYHKDTGEKTSPKLTEDSYGSIRPGLGEKIAHRMVVSHRLGVLNGLLRDVRADGRIEAQANTLGTNTCRMRHKRVVNIPKAKKHVFFGKEIRSCFIVKPGYKLVGCDAVGLENRWIAHFLANPEVNSIFTEGDFHEKFTAAISEFASDRDNGKQIEYAYFFGATDPKLGYLANKQPPGMSRQQIGKAIRDTINVSVPGLDDLIRKVQRAADRGYLVGIDGRRLKVRSRHSAFNTLIQSSGAIMMKIALCFLDRWIKDEGLDAKFVGNFHDEFQLEVLEKDVKRVRELSVKSIVKAGEYLNTTCPMVGDSKVGDNWALTH